MDPINVIIAIILGASGNALYDVLIKGTVLLNRSLKTERFLRGFRRKHENELKCLHEQAKYGKLPEDYFEGSSSDILEKFRQDLYKSLQRPEFKSLASDVREVLHSHELQRNMIADGFLCLKSEHDDIRSNFEEVKDLIRQLLPEATTPGSRRERIVNVCPLDTMHNFRNRVCEIQEFYEYLVEDGVRLVGVLGRGGMGKTALASYVLANLERGTLPVPSEARRLYADGIIYLGARTTGLELERIYTDVGRMLGDESG